MQETNEYFYSQYYIFEQLESNLHCIDLTLKAVYACEAFIA